MNVLRTVGNYELNKGEGMANGLFNISNTKDHNKLSLWFDRETKNELIQLNNNEFEQMAKEFCKV